MQDLEEIFLQARYPSGHPRNSVKALKGHGKGKGKTLFT